MPTAACLLAITAAILVGCTPRAAGTDVGPEPARIPWDGITFPEIPPDTMIADYCAKIDGDIPVDLLAIRFEPGSTVAERAGIIERFNGRLVGGMRRFPSPLYIVQFPTERMAEVFRLVEALAPHVLFVSPLWADFYHVVGRCRTSSLQP